MKSTTSHPKSCDPQLLAELPQESWGIEKLREYAQSQHQTIDRGERSLAPHYWRLGLALNLARRQFAHHQWEQFLEHLGIDKTRASKARAIHRTFTTSSVLEGMSVQEVYARRERKPRELPRTKRRIKAKPAGLSHWLREVCQKADLYLDEAKFTDPAQSSAVLAILDAAIAELTRLRERLQNPSGA